MLGAIAGDIIGSVHEYAKTKTKEFPLFTRHSSFTDDSILTVAVADWILAGKDLVDLFHEYTRAYPGRGYGSMKVISGTTRLSGNKLDMNRST